MYMPKGTVKLYSVTKGYGFIAPEDGSAEVFVHVTEVQRAGLGGLVEGQKVSYELQRDLKRGKVAAVNIRTL